MKNSFILGLLSLAAVSGDCSAKDSFLDLYVGGGIGLEFAKNDNTFETTAPNIDALGNIVPGSIISNDFDGRYSDRKIKDSRTTRPSASFVLGVGKHNKNGTYVGVEGGIDISKNREIKTNGGMGYDYTANLLNATSHSDIKLNAISYNLGVLLGLYNNNWMYYIKPTLLLNRISIDNYITNYGAGVAATNAYSVGSSSKNTSFALAFGVERKLSQKLGIRLECEYAFPRKIKANNDSYVFPYGTYQLETQINRFKVRALVTYRLLNSWISEDSSCTCELSDRFNGVFLGAGIGMNILKAKSYRVANNVGPLVAAAAIGAKRVFDDQNVCRPFGTLSLGYGHSFSNHAFLGLDAIFDFGPSRSKSVKSRGIEIIESGHDSDGGYVKYSGIAAEIGPRLGYVLDSSLVYIRPAAVFNKVEIYNDSRRTVSGPETKLSGHPSSVAFGLALGVEKAIKEKFSVRAEVERVFRRSHWTNSASAHGGTDTGWRTGGNVNGYNARVILSYKI